LSASLKRSPLLPDLNKGWITVVGFSIIKGAFPGCVLQRVLEHMRIAVISDIHGNQVALEAVLRDLDRQPDIAQIVIAGDLCLNGPRPREVLSIIRALGCPVIQGNVDADVAREDTLKRPKKQDTVGWTREQIGEDGIAYLASLPFYHLVVNTEGTDLLVVHANPLNQDEAIYSTTPDSQLEVLLGNLAPTIGVVAFGHYHVAYQRRWRHLLLVDTGSCGLPRDGDIRAAYAILSSQNNTWRAEHRRVAYDVNATVKQLKQCGIPYVEKRIKVLLAATY
jgi:putative phosphoesterase